MTQVAIIGAGPSGLFAAEILRRSGVGCTIFDAGKEMERRECPELQECNCKVCDILEGVGGAGGFSDGKNTYSLTRGTQMEDIFAPESAALLQEIDNLTVLYGCEGVLTDPLKEPHPLFLNTPFEFGSYPLRHIGSDGIRKFITNIAAHLRRWNVIIRSDTEVIYVKKTDPYYEVCYRRPSGEVQYDLVDKVMIATGLQGTPWLESQLEMMGVPLKPGPAGIGMRFESRYETLEPLFSAFYDFKLTKVHGSIPFRSFCCNRRGYVVNENHRTLGIKNVNGHSFLNERMKSNASNFAIIAKIGEDIDTDPQGYVREMARRINGLVEGGTVVQRAKDFVSERPSIREYFPIDSVHTNSQARSSVHIGSAMPRMVYEGFRNFLMDLDEIVPGILHSTSVVYAPEVKYYGKKAPVDFTTWECQGMPGLYITGNASGYLDSFVSAALSGMIAANHITDKKGD